MDVTDLLAPRFDDVIRRRGMLCRRAGSVRIVLGNQDEVLALVHGRQGDYDVHIAWSGTELTLSCTCPHFADRGPCKHLWATALVAEERKFLHPLRGQEQAAQGGRRAATDVVSVGGVQVEVPIAASASPKRRAERTPRRREATWRKWMREFEDHAKHRPPLPAGDTRREFRYVLDLLAWGSARRTELAAEQRVERRTGDWGKWKALDLRADEIAQQPEPVDRHLLPHFVSAGPRIARGPLTAHQWQAFHPLPTLLEHLLPLLCRTGRFHLRDEEGRISAPLRWDEGGPWELRGEFIQADAECLFRGRLHRDGAALDVSELEGVLPEGWIVANGAVSALADASLAPALLTQRRSGTFPIERKEVDDFLEALLRQPIVPPLDLPPEFGLTVERNAPVAHLEIKPHPYDRAEWHAEATFNYAGHCFGEAELYAGGLDRKAGRIILRDHRAEAAARQTLDRLGIRSERHHSSGGPRLLPSGQLAAAVKALLAAGWQVALKGKAYQTGSLPALQLASGIDWFELRGGAKFGDEVVALPRLLTALRKNEGLIPLRDGGMGVLPDDWLRQWSGLAALGETHGDVVRFQPGQAGLLDALLAALPEVSFDAEFARIRAELQRFTAIEPADAPAGFQGQLRDYQRDGLGWLLFLQRFGLGGCLADDMGLGKTIQVLALLEGRRALRASAAGSPDRPGPSLAVVPRSLIFNWLEEARRFTPQLRIHDHTGTYRLPGTDHFEEHDLILTTYGTLRRDAAQLRAYPFDYVILDEAQAIKNAGTQAAKASRLLQAKHRLAMSGTPIENRLADLWSLFAFLNPGLLGAATRFEQLGKEDGEAGEAARTLLARALRPYILRRTKGQVARELPERTEQTIHCEMPPHQRKLYDELREHYRKALLPRISDSGFGREKILILEALLRLRQAACHPALIDRKESGAGSAKLSALVPQLAEVAAEGHKALVFSQFTTFLALVRKELEAAGMSYEYLDGRTTDRQKRVRRFQDDPACKVFLVSLKAGGLGLNLTAADYVFLLDPWWNPAVEAQAIDRAHRIGQTRQVFAYRLIAKDSIEEKVLELQAKKRGLADAIISADQSVLRNLTRADLEMLLG